MIARVSWDTRAAVTETRRRDPVLVILLAVAGWHLLALHLPAVALRQGEGPWPWVVTVAVFLSAWAAYAAGLTRLTEPGRERTLALSLVGASAAVVLLERLASRYLGDHPEFLIDLARITPYLVVVPLVAAWGVVRRNGRWWPAGLLATAGLLWALNESYTVHELSVRLQVEAVLSTGAPYAGFHQDLQVAVAWAIAWLLPMLAGGLACWLIERYAAAEPDSAEHT